MKVAKSIFAVLALLSSGALSVAQAGGGHGGGNGGASSFSPGHEMQNASSTSSPSTPGASSYTPAAEMKEAAGSSTSSSTGSSIEHGASAFTPGFLSKPKSK